MSRCSLYQLTQTEVMFSGWVRIAYRPAAKQGAVADALRLVEPDRLLAQRAIEGIADRSQPMGSAGQHQCLAVMYCSVATSGVPVMDCIVERMTFVNAQLRSV